MKKDLQKEIIWQLAIALLAIVIFATKFGIENLISKSMDFSFHDSYIVASPIYIISIIILVLSFLITGSRVALSKFNNLIPNTIFIISICILILVIWFNIDNISTMLSMSSNNKTGWTVYPPSAELPISPPNNNVYSKDHIKNTLKIIQGSLFLILIITAQTSFRKLRKASP